MKALGSILEHFEELFGRHLGTKSDPGATWDRFFGEMRDSVNTLLFTTHSKGSPGPDRIKKRFWNSFWVTKNGAENRAVKRWSTTAFGSDFGSDLGGQNA